MVETRNLSRLAAGLVAIAPVVALFAASCGTSGNVADSEGGADSAALDGPTIDGPRIDGAVGEGGDGGPADARVASDAADASDGPLVAAPFVTGVLGSADRFAVFSGGTVENATETATTITGDLGTYPGSAAIGLTPPVVVGTEHLGDGVAQTAAADIQVAYDRLISGHLPCGTDLTGTDLGGTTLPPGVYCFSSTAALTGTLTLDAQNDPDAVWVFQVGSALTTAAGSRVVVVDGAAAQVCNAFWQITSAATLGTNSVFGGTILAYSAVTITTGTSVVGRAFALTAKVSTDTNVVSIEACPLGATVLDGGPLEGGDGG
jgi:Ice-binding-like